MQVQSLILGSLGKVGYPLLIRSTRLEVALQIVGCDVVVRSAALTASRLNSSVKLLRVFVMHIS